MTKMKADGVVLSNRYVPDSATVLGDVAGAVGVLGSRSANFASSMSLNDIINVGVTNIAANRGEMLRGMPATELGVAVRAGPSNFLSAAALSGGWALTGVVGLSIYIIGNVYVALHQRLEAHHNAVVSLYKCYGMLLRIENFLKAAEIYCKTYDFQIDSLEIQDDLMNVFRVLDEITTQDDIRKVYTNVQEGRTFTLNSAGPNHDQVIASPTQGSPFKSFFSNRLGAIKKSTGAVFHKIMTNVAEWCNRFNGIMIELNMHFTLLTSEFFMLANIRQMQTPAEKNQGFASMMNEPVIENQQNPLWCIKLQIMLAPFLRVRNILFSCALSTNTELCRLTANKEMQDIDQTNGFTRKALWAYFKRLFRVYTIEEAKTINIGLFLQILRNATDDVTANCYFRNLHQTDRIHIVVNELSTLLASPNISKDHGLFMKVLDLLDEIYKIVLACGRTNLTTGVINLESNQFHSDHFKTSQTLLHKERVLTLKSVIEVQLRPFSYANQAGLFSIIGDIGKFVTNKCAAIGLMPPIVDERPYNIAAHVTETEVAIANRLRAMNRPVITTDPAEAAAGVADALNAAASISQLLQVQLAYNALYKFVMAFDPKSVKTAAIVEQRGKWLAGCILLIERVEIGAVILSQNDISSICVKCKTLIDMIASHDAPRSVNQIPVLFRSVTIPNMIMKIINLSEGVKEHTTGRAAAEAAAAAAPAAAEAEAAAAAADAAAANSLSVSIAKAAQAVPAHMTFGQTVKAKIRSARSVFGKGSDKIGLLGAEAPSGGRRNDLRKTRRMRHKCNDKCSKRLRAHRRLNRICTRRRR
jgi:hypothetical protein